MSNEQQQNRCSILYIQLVIKRGAQKLVHEVMQQPVHSCYLEDHWPWVGGLSAVNAVGTQSRDLVKHGADPTAFDGILLIYEY